MGKNIKNNIIYIYMCVYIYTCIYVYTWIYTYLSMYKSESLFYMAEIDIKFKPTIFQ